MNRYVETFLSALRRQTPQKELLRKLEADMERRRLSLDEAYMQMAEIWAQRSYAVRLQVGALLVKDKRIVSDGYNGMPTGFPNIDIEHVDDKGLLVTNVLGLHAESNAILKCASSGGSSSEGATMYVTHSPCVPCAKLIIQAKIARVVYRNEYRNTDALPVLRRAGIIVDRLPPFKDERKL